MPLPRHAEREVRRGVHHVARSATTSGVIVAAEKAPTVLFALLKCLKDECGFDFLADLGGIDYLHYPNATDRYGVVYA